MQNVHLTPPAIARLLNVNVSTIKRWVDNGLLDSTKTPGGHRRVSKQQLSEFVKRYPQLQANSYIIKRFTKQRASIPLTWKKYYHYLLVDRNEKAEQLLKELFVTQHSVVSILDNVLTPTLAHIGTEWRQQHISIYEEHRMSLIIRQHLLLLDQIVFSKPISPSAPMAILACVEGDHHELTLYILSVLLKAFGYKPIILGINVPYRELERACITLKPKIIGISKTYSKSAGLPYLKKVAQLADEEQIDCVYGGSGWSKFDQKQMATLKLAPVYYVAGLSQFQDWLTTHHKIHFA